MGSKTISKEKKTIYILEEEKKIKERRRIERFIENCILEFNMLRHNIKIVKLSNVKVLEKTSIQTKLEIREISKFNRITKIIINGKTLKLLNITIIKNKKTFIAS